VSHAELQVLQERDAEDACIDGMKAARYVCSQGSASNVGKTCRKRSEREATCCRDEIAWPRYSEYSLKVYGGVAKRLHESERGTHSGIRKAGFKQNAAHRKLC
jgi:hypothetical protein